MDRVTEYMLVECGDFGRSQYVMLMAFGVINVLASINYYSQTIITFVPAHWCYAEELANKTIEEIREIYSSYPNPHCTPYNTRGNHDQFGSVAYELRGGEERCDRWFYEFDHGYQSMSSELNWVCDSAWKSTIGQSMFFVGSVFGTQIFGGLADTIGRLPVLIFANVMGLIGNGITVFSTNVPIFSISRFVSGLAVDSNFLMMYILVLEYIRPSMRTFGLNLVIGIFYCLGSMVTPWIAVYLGSWKSYLIYTSLPIAIVPFFYFILPESAQWMLSRNNIEGAIVCYKRVAKFNGRTLDNETIESFRSYYQNQLSKSANSRGPSLLDLFRTPRLRKHTLILFFKSMVITLCYDAMSRNVEGLGISPFVMFTLSASAIFPGCLVLLALQDRIGRKAMASSSLLLSGIFTAASGVILVYQSGVQSVELLVTLSVIGRFGVTVAYNSAAQYATELIPTCVRGQGIATVHVAGYAFTFFSSYILYLSHYFLPLPSLVLGTLSLAGAALCLFLPETLNRTLPTTLDEGERFGEGEKFYHFACFDKKELTESTTVLDSVLRNDEGHVNAGAETYTQRTHI